ncbi:hypothetical protein TrVE_jg2457 [Triparma verrucosa]|uniref:B30.2/SPRY domain-containing protein n=1 Tax=Triparma verrucosa TaxID=1606542 RepID=A0A9W7C6J8_9STRA|nr:hypothetical protein TrVE_jg2457 [Triparma verrucosa]
MSSPVPSGTSPPEPPDREPLKLNDDPMCIDTDEGTGEGVNLIQEKTLLGLQNGLQNDKGKEETQEETQEKTQEKKEDTNTQAIEGAIEGTGTGTGSMEVNETAVNKEEMEGRPGKEEGEKKSTQPSTQEPNAQPEKEEDAADNNDKTTKRPAAAPPSLPKPKKQKPGRGRWPTGKSSTPTSVDHTASPPPKSNSFTYSDDNGVDVLGPVGTAAVRTLLKWGENNSARHATESSSLPPLSPPPVPPKYPSQKLYSLLKSSLLRLQKSSSLSPPSPLYFSPRDSAPQILFYSPTSPTGHLPSPTLESKNLPLLDLGSSKGYRMSRATSGVNAHVHYWECLIINGGKITQKPTEDPDDVEPGVRVGVAMRTGDLQGPVGFDKWSYGYRDINGSKVHCSRREEEWGGEGYGAGDIVGIEIELGGKGEGGEVRFYKNGRMQGKFEEVRGKTEGGVAFEVTPGIYYPAASFFNGGRIVGNFGPKFVYPPSSKSNAKPWCGVVERRSVADAEEEIKEREKAFKAFKEVKRGGGERVERDPMPLLEAVSDLAAVTYEQKRYEKHVEENKKWVDEIVRDRKEKKIYHQQHW